ncbi:MAG TPA: HAMP domain-containing sensor histidine kinase [Candidatus Dormibacteraeota bacterium]|nr:HAMP domain-containing sensor histidine kinase [Candidatus Dormibacteraeota bacterium]
MINPEPATGAGHPSHSRSSAQAAPDLLVCVLEALPLGMGLFEFAGDDVIFRAGNREFARVLRLDRRPLNGQDLTDVFTHAEGDDVRQVFSRVRSRAEPQSYFAPDAASKGHRIWNIDVYPVFTAGQVTHVMALAEQIEETLEVRQRQQHETDRLREKADHLAELEKAKSEFLRLASHELRGPAAMLGGYLSMMEEEALGPIPERLRPVLPLLRAKAAQINMLANEMVEAARLEDRRLQLKRKRVDLRDVVRRSVKSVSTGLSHKHTLRFEDRAAAGVPIQADMMRLEIIINNLIDNAIKYSPHGGDITVELSTAGDLAMVSVRDFGIGIAAEDMDRLFIRFNRIAPQADVPGTGLGLYLARELARLHGGDIAAVSSLGEGSKFTLSLPLDTGKK